MNINRKYIIIFGTLVLLLVIITGTITYYKERKSEELMRTSTKIHSVPSFNYSYPISSEEADSFQKFCAITATPSFMSSMSSLLNEEFVEEQETIVNRCILIQKEDTTDSENKYVPAFSLLRKVPVLHQSQYIAVSINLNDLFKESAQLLQSEENNFNLCTITRPALIEPFREQLLLKDQINLNRNIVFPEGEVFCSKFFGLYSEMRSLIISGFVPKVDVFQAEIYLISEDKTVNDILSQESFTDIEELLQSYPLLWNVEKSVI